MNILKGLIDKADIISFDMFDTLIKRNVKHPTDIFSYVELVYNRIHHTNIRFKTIRVQAESKVRKNIRGEISLNQIYEEVSARLGADLAESFKLLECKAEIDFCCVNPEIKTYVEYAKKKGKRIIVISDMYQNIQTLDAMLLKCGFDSFDYIYVSSEFKVTKQSGQLFPIILNREGVQPDRLLHIGDNEIADFKQPKKYGIQSFFYKRTLKYYPYSESTNLISNHELGVQLDTINTFIDNTLSEHESSDYKLGYSVFGPLLCGFISWINDTAQEKGIDKILFCSRDGYLPELAYRKSQCAISANYFYISRISIINSSIYRDKNIIQSLDRFKSWPSAFNLNYALNRLGIYGKHKSIIFKNINTLFSGDWITKDIQLCYEEKKQQSKEQGDLLKKYILDLIRNHKKIAIVDIGGNRTIEKNLRGFLQHENIMIDLYSLNLCISDKETFEICSYLYDDKKNRHISRKLAPLYYFLEILLTAPHGSVLSYMKATDSCRPVLEKYDYTNESYSKQMLIDLQRGALNFVENFRLLSSEYIKISPEIAINNLLNFGITPSTTDFCRWESFKFNADGLKKLVEFDSVSAYIKKPTKFIGDYRQSLWKAGFLRKALHNRRLVKYLYMIKS